MRSCFGSGTPPGLCILVHMEERLQKFLARCGVASRRRAEVLIVQGRITVNGKAVSVLGTKVDPVRDRVSLDGKTVVPPAALTYLALHKPAGFLTTREDPHGRRTVYDLLPQDCAHLVPVGRLDYQSEGLLFFTDDGAWANHVAHPRYGGEKEYAVLVNGRLISQQQEALRAPMVLDGYQLNAIKMQLMHREDEGTWMTITLTEGRKRQIRQMLAAIGKHALRLIRVRIGPVRLGKLAAGEFRSLSQSEVEHWHDPPQSPHPQRKAAAPALLRQNTPATNTTGADRADSSFASAAVGIRHIDHV
ncbi:MAG: pseudouridine synthase [Chloroflexi bacterium]|nr:pseudouridine synthase [Chloroflexota bacterium]